MPTNSIGYFTDSIASQPAYRCLQCQFDTFEHQNIINHVQFSHSPIQLPQESPNLLVGKRIGIGFLTWNTCEASVLGMRAIQKELLKLKGLGIATRCFWWDNGSSDGTIEQVFNECLNAPEYYNSRINVGQSRARNWILGSALSAGCDYLLMVDGDIEIIPFSAYAMGNLLMKAPKDIGCVGMYCRNCTHQMDSEVALECKVIDHWMLDADPPIAWTNYGMFRREVLECCRFDYSDVFTGPGWGFEDDDYQMQMFDHGYTSVNTKYFRHLHRRRHSSVRLLGESLVTKVHENRKKYLVDKWKSSTNPNIQRLIQQLANQTMPVLEY